MTILKILGNRDLPILGFMGPKYFWDPGIVICSCKLSVIEEN